MIFLLHSIWIFALLYLFLIGFKPSLSRTYKLLFITTISWLALFWTGSNSSVFSNLATSTNWTNPTFSNWIYIYCLGVGFQFIRHFRSFYQTQLLKSSGIKLDFPKLEELMGELLLKFNLKKVVQLRFHDQINVPMVVGYFKPVLLFPIGLINHLSAEEVEAILAHELQHIQQNDYIWNLFMVVLESVLFFNPFVYLVHKHIRLLREVKADQKAVELGKNPKVLARTLITIEEYIQKEHLAISLNGSDLNYRIRKMLSLQVNDSTGAISKLTCLLAIVLCAGIFIQYELSEYEEIILNADNSSQNYFKVDLENTELMQSVFESKPEIEGKSERGKINQLSSKPADEKLTLQFMSVDNVVVISKSSSTDLRQAAILQTPERKTDDEIKGTNPKSKIVDWSVIKGYQYGKSRNQLVVEDYSKLPVISSNVEDRNQERNIIIKMNAQEMGKNRTLELDFNSEMWLLVSLLKSDLSLEDGVGDILRYYIDESILNYELVIIGDSVYLNDEELDENVSSIVIKYVESKERSNDVDGQIFFKIIKK